MEPNKESGKSAIERQAEFVARVQKIGRQQAILRRVSLAKTKLDFWSQFSDSDLCNLVMKKFGLPANAPLTRQNLINQLEKK